MAYLGTPIDTRNQFQSLQGKRFNGDGSTTAFTLDVAPSSTLDIEVFVGNVRQDPNSAYTLSGTTLTFTGAPPSGTNNIYVVHQAKAVGTLTPGANTVGVTELNLSDGSSGQAITTDGSGTLSFSSVGVSGISSSADATAITIDSSENVNIGDATNRGYGPLQLGDTSDSHAYIQMLSSVSGQIHFGDATSGDAREIGAIQYRHDENVMKLKTSGNVGLQIDSAGHVTTPLTSAFEVTQTGALSVADGHTLFSTNTTEVKDLNADFSGGTFTAPVDGFYYFSCSVLYQGLGSGDTDTVEDTFVFSNGNKIISRAGKANNALSSGGYMESAKGLISFMDANDTVICRHDDGGTLTVHANAHASHFEGFLLG